MATAETNSLSLAPSMGSGHTMAWAEAKTLGLASTLGTGDARPVSLCRQPQSGKVAVGAKGSKYTLVPTRDLVPLYQM